MNAHAESTTLGDVLKCEAPNLYSREAVTVLAGDGAERALKVGAVIARRTRSTVTVTAGDGNTGDGAATLADPAARRPGRSRHLPARLHHRRGSRHLPGAEPEGLRSA